MIRKRRIVVAAAFGALAVFGLMGAGVASAATLKVTPAREVTVAKAQKCAATMSGSNPVVQTAFVSGTSVTVKSVPAACAGLSLKVTLHNSAGTVLATGTVASAAATQTITVGSYTAASVTNAFVTIGGWIFPSTWTAPVPAGACVGVDAAGNPTGDACTLTMGTVTSWTAGAYKYSQFQFSAVTSAPRWKVTFNFADTSKFVGFTPVVVANSQNVAKAPGYSCSSLPVFVGVEANPAWGSANGDLTISTDPALTGDRLCPAP